MYATLLALTLALAPFTGTPPAHAQSGTATFTVDVHGRPRQTVRLRATRIASGYIASFCTSRICAPFAVTLVLPSSGQESIELQVIENIAGSPAPRRVRVEAAGARPAAIDYAAGRQR